MPKSISAMSVKIGTEVRCPGRMALVCVITVFLSLSVLTCSADQKNLNAFAPAESIIYLEVPDLGAALDALTENRKFRRSSTSKVDLSGLNGIQVAVAVSGFETSESPVSGDGAVLNFRPQFTVIAETHLWSWQVTSLVEGQLNSFVERAYGGAAKLEISERDGDQWYIWSAKDGRKAFAAIHGSKVYFGNNEDGLKKALDVANGKAESLQAKGHVSLQPRGSERKIAFGVITSEGVRQLAGIAGISLAIDGSGDESEKGIVSEAIPEFAGNSISEVAWTARTSDAGVEDELVISVKGNIGEALSETLQPANSEIRGILDFVPGESYSVSRYNLKDPRIAFRSVLIAFAQGASPRAAKLMPLIGESLLEPYGVKEPEQFLSFCGQTIVTVRIDESGDRGLAIVRTSAFERIRRHISAGVGMNDPTLRRFGAEIWMSEDRSFAAARRGDFLVLGDPEAVLSGLESAEKVQVPGKSDIRRAEGFSALRRPVHISVTITRDTESIQKITSLLGAERTASNSEDSFNLTTTDFERGSIRRKYLSSFGFIGAVIEQFDADQ